MIFEETLVFYNPSDAENFMRQLFAQGYRAKMKKINTLVNEAHCKAKISDLKLYFADALKDAKDDAGNGEVAEEVSETYSSIIADIDTVIADLKEFLSARDDGAVISDDPDVKRFLEIMKKEGMAENAPTDGAAASDGNDDFFSRMLRIMLVLNDNGMIEDLAGKDGADGDKGDNGEERKILHKKDIPVEDLIMSMPSDLFLGGNSQKNRREHNIKTVVNVVSGAEYHVTTPIEYSISANFDKLDRMVADYDIDPASYTKMKENIVAKTIIAKNILACIKNGGKTTVDEIYEVMNSASVDLSSGTDEFMFDLSREFIAAVMSEMKVMGIIKGKGNRFRV